MSIHEVATGTEPSFVELAGAGRNHWWRYLLTILAIIPAVFVSFLLVAFLVWIAALGHAPVSGELGAGDLSFDKFLEVLSEGIDDRSTVSTADALAAFVSLMAPSALTLVVFLSIVVLVHRRPWRTLMWARTRFYWKGFLISLAVTAGLLSVDTLLAVLIFPDKIEFILDVDRYVLFLPFVLVLVPLQVLAEEVVFRGYLLQMTARITRISALRILFPAALFMIVHLGNKPVEHGGVWAVLIYATYGLYMTLLAVKGNGLEYTLGFHLGLNLFAMLVITSAESGVPTPTILFEQAPDFLLVFVEIVVLCALHYWIVFRLLRNKDRIARVRRADTLASMPTAERPKAMYVRNMILCLATVFLFAAAFLWAIYDPDMTSDQSSKLEAAYNSYETLNQQGRYSEAESYAKEALRLGTEEFGPDDPSTAVYLDNLALVYHAQGRYAEAEPFHKRSLAIREKVFGPEHPQVARNLNNLAVLYQDQGRYAEAEPLHKRASAIREAALGPEHPDVAQSLNDLALLYLYQGHYAEAEPLQERSLEIWEKALGPEHPDVATGLHNLALLYDDQGRYAEAEPLYMRALAITEKALGSDHPEVATSLDELAGLYRDQGNYAEAEPLHQRSLAIREKALGPEHPHVAASLNSMVELYRVQRRYVDAEPLQMRAQAIWEKSLGPEHPHVATSLNNLALLYDDQGRYAEAEPLYLRALAIMEKALGSDHPHVANNVDNIAGLYRDQGRYAEAEPLYQRSLASRENALGPEHPDVATSLENYAALLRQSARPDEAAKMEARAKAIRAQSE